MNHSDYTYDYDFENDHVLIVIDDDNDVEMVTMDEDEDEVEVDYSKMPPLEKVHESDKGDGLVCCPVEQFAVKTKGNISWSRCEWRGRPEAALIHMFTCHGDKRSDADCCDRLLPLDWIWTVGEDVPSTVVFKYSATLWDPQHGYDVVLMSTFVNV